MYKLSRQKFSLEMSIFCLRLFFSEWCVHSISLDSALIFRNAKHEFKYIFNRRVETSQHITTNIWIVTYFENIGKLLFIIGLYISLFTDVSMMFPHSIKLTGSITIVSTKVLMFCATNVFDSNEISINCIIRVYEIYILCNTKLST